MTSRAAVVLASYGAVPPPGVDPDAFAAACLADTYEVLTDLVDVTAGIAADDLTEVSASLWPGDLGLETTTSPAAAVRDVLAQLVERGFDEAVVVTADAPDLPGLVVAKLFKALRHADVALAPARHSDRAVALGVRLPAPGWLPTVDLDDPGLAVRLRAAAPGSRGVAVGPDWHRLDTPGSVDRLDPGLEGWDEVRLLLSR